MNRLNEVLSDEKDIGHYQMNDVLSDKKDIGRCQMEWG